MEEMEKVEEKEFDISASAVGSRILSLIRLARINRPDFAKDINVSIRTIQNWGRVYPTIENIFKVARYFDVSTDFIIAGIGEDKVKEKPINPIQSDFDKLSETNKKLVRELIKQLSRL